MSKGKDRKKYIYDVWPKKNAFKSWRPEISIRNGIHVNKSIMEGDNWYVAIKKILVIIVEQATDISALYNCWLVGFVKLNFLEKNLIHNQNLY